LFLFVFSALHNAPVIACIVVSYDILLGWTTDGSEFESLYGQELSLHVVQSSSEANPVFYTIDSWGSLPWGKAAGA
jgi:hypothetical protein